MAESHLLRSYREQEDREIDALISQARGRLATQQSQEQSLPPSGEEPFPAGATVPQSSTGREPGVGASLKRGLDAIPERFKQGVSDIAEAVNPSRSLSDLVNENEAPGYGQRALQFVLGGLNAIFPFSAFAGEVGGDVGEWIAKTSGELTDDRLQAALASAREAESKHGMDPGRPDGSRTIEGLLSIPYDERIARAREAASISAEALAGIVPGYTSSAPIGRREIELPPSVAKPPKPVTR